MIDPLQIVSLQSLLSQSAARSQAALAATANAQAALVKTAGQTAGSLSKADSAVRKAEAAAVDSAAAAAAAGAAGLTRLTAQARVDAATIRGQGVEEAGEVVGGVGQGLVALDHGVAGEDEVEGVQLQVGAPVCACVRACVRACDDDDDDDDDVCVFVWERRWR